MKQLLTLVAALAISLPANATTPPPTASSKPAMPQTTMTQAQANLPLFYRDLAAFDTTLHGSLAFPDPVPDYRFASAANIIPLLANEVPLALQHYPLVFIAGTQDQAPTLAAVVGLGDNQNRFVDNQGQWRAETYIPAWVRRYPFIAVAPEAGKEPILALDPKAEWLNQSGGQPLLDKEHQPTDRLKFILAFNREFQQIAERTNAMAKALQEAGVLEEGSLKITPPGGTPEQATEIKGFLIVNEQKLRTLKGKALQKLHEADGFGLAYAQLFSMVNLGKLVETPRATADTKSKR